METSGETWGEHDDEAHPKLGNRRDTINKLCLQRYLMKEKWAAARTRSGIHRRSAPWTSCRQRRWTSTCWN